jgi:hypothetical protein
MPLQIRRGTTAQRLAITPLTGELIHDTTTGQLFVGNGTTAGGVTTTGITLEDAADTAASLFSTGSHSGITFAYNDAAGRIDATVTVAATGPFDGDLTGSVFSDNSTLLVDGTGGRIVGPVATDSVIINNTTDSIGLDFRRYIGSVGSSTITPNNTQLGDIHFYGQTGVADSALGGAAAYIQSFVNGTPAGGYVPGAIDFHVQQLDGLDNPILRLLGGDGYIVLNEAVRHNSDKVCTDGIQYMLRQHHSTADANNFSFYRGRGTEAAPQAIQNGDDIIDIAFGGYTAFGVYGIGASISAIVDGTVSANIVPTKLVFRTHNGTTSAERITIDKTGALLCTQSILTSAGGIGYTTGAGGTVSQGTSKSTGVTLSKLTGVITTFSDLLTPSTNVVFTLTNTLVTATDHVIVSHINGGTLGAYNVVATAGTGSVQITLRNITGGSLTESPILKFTVIKSVTS